LRRRQQTTAKCYGRQMTTRRQTGNGNLPTGSSFRRPEVASSGPLQTVRVLLDVKRGLMSPFSVAPRPEVVSSGQTVAVSPYIVVKSNRKSCIASSLRRLPPYFHFRLGWKRPSAARKVRIRRVVASRPVQSATDVRGRPDIKPETVVFRPEVVFRDRK